MSFSISSNSKSVHGYKFENNINSILTPKEVYRWLFNILFYLVSKKCTEQPPWVRCCASTRQLSVVLREQTLKPNGQRQILALTQEQ